MEAVLYSEFFDGELFYAMSIEDSSRKYSMF
jgi:hypothetical protein